MKERHKHIFPVNLERPFAFNSIGTAKIRIEWKKSVSNLEIYIFPWFFNTDNNYSCSCISFWHCYMQRTADSPMQLCTCWAVSLMCPLSLHLQGLFRTKSGRKTFNTGSSRCKRTLNPVREHYNREIMKWTLENPIERQKKCHYRSRIATETKWFWNSGENDGCPVLFVRWMNMLGAPAKHSFVHARLWRICMHLHGELVHWRLIVASIVCIKTMKQWTILATLCMRV